MRALLASLALLTAVTAGVQARAADSACDPANEGCAPAATPPDPTTEGSFGGGGLTNGAKAGDSKTTDKTAQHKAATSAERLYRSAQEAARQKARANAAPSQGTTGTQRGALGSGNAAGEKPGLDGEGNANGQIAREILGDDKDAPVGQRVARLHSGGEKALYSGVVMVATGITQVSLAEQDRAENGANEENTQLREIGTQNIAQGTQQIEAGRATIDHGNNVARHENKRASVGASSAMPIRPSTFDQSRATSEANQKLEEMERVAGVPAAALVQAVNSGGREEIVSLAGGAKGVGEGYSADLHAAIPNFGTSEARPSGGGSAPPPAQTWSQPAPAAASAERKPAASERKVASAEPAQHAEPESLQSLGADNLLRSLGAKEIASAAPAREERSLFQRVSRQYTKRNAELR